MSESEYGVSHMHRLPRTTGFMSGPAVYCGRCRDVIPVTAEWVRANIRGQARYGMPDVNLVTSADVAALLGVSVRTVSRMVARGDLVPVVKAPGLRGALLFDPAHVARLARERVPRQHHHARRAGDAMTGHWSDQALCAQFDPELFFPVLDNAAYANANRAKRVCANCPVSDPCLLYALEHNIEFGIWGGTTRGDRRELRRTASPGWEASA